MLRSFVSFISAAEAPCERGQDYQAFNWQAPVAHQSFKVSSPNLAYCCFARGVRLNSAVSAGVVSSPMLKRLLDLLVLCTSRESQHVDKGNV